MKAICSRDRLIEAINIVQRAIPTRTTMNILQGILIRAEDGLTLTSYDKEIGIDCLMEADVTVPGSLVVPARMFGDMIRKLPDDLVTIESVASQSIQIESGSSRFTIKTYPAEDYPTIPEVERSERVTIKQQVLKDMIRQTIFAVSVDESRRVLNGAFFKAQDQQLEMVAIDGFRLALRQVSCEDPIGDIAFIIPGKVLNEVGRILTTGTETVDLYLSQNHLLFDLGSVKIVSRLIQGEYMNYRGILPQTAETTLTVGTQALLSAVERASLIIVSEERRFPFRLTLSDDDTLVVSAHTDVGTLREELSVAANGNSFDIDFNPRYFIEALRVIEDEEITVVFNGSMGPCVLKPLQEEAFAYLVLPLRR